ncbi:hypothetical protein [Streptomyces sp. WMMB303]|uniref:hypothetical protein n=1 Tax=Streptomyces sp. WMMB303 TaxID=3034154 RepID=UPI0023EDB34F|nr:hypothetical protein [Streptomyces sp. WMMB303]MDF4250330.1 hypothetical protein [Streptomyces sp. WMMB303]
MWAVGDAAQDRKTGRTGEIIQVTGPAPFIYRLKVREDGQPPLVVYRYGDQLQAVHRPEPVAVRRRCRDAAGPAGNRGRT